MQIIYNTDPNKTTDIATPIFPDFSQDSAMSKKMIRAKQVNDDNYWTVMREVLNHDCDTLPMDRFKVWYSVWSVPLMSSTKHSQYIKVALQAAYDDPVYYNALQEPIIGMTEEDFQRYFAMFSDYPTTMNRIQCISHLLVNGFDYNKIRKMKRIVEIGAGVGDLADIACKLGFEGEYIIYDFEETGRIQKWYHDALGHKNIVHTNDLDDLTTADLVIGTFSLTEMPFDLRNDVVDRLKDSNEWLIAYSNLIFGYDNRTWVQEKLVPLGGNGKTVQFTDISFMPWDGGSAYFVLKNS